MGSDKERACTAVNLSAYCVDTLYIQDPLQGIPTFTPSQSSVRHLHNPRRLDTFALPFLPQTFRTLKHWRLKQDLSVPGEDPRVTTFQSSQIPIQTHNTHGPTRESRRAFPLERSLSLRFWMPFQQPRPSLLHTVTITDTTAEATPPCLCLDHRRRNRMEDGRLVG